MTIDYITITGGNNPVPGRAVIIHAKADDLVSQPTGSAGARVACDTIGFANRQSETTPRDLQCNPRG